MQRGPLKNPPTPHLTATPVPPSPRCRSPPPKQSPQHQAAHTHGCTHGPPACSCAHVRASPRTHTALQCTHRACNRFARCRRRTACFVCPFFSFLFPFPACIFFRLKTNPCILLLLPLSSPAINSKERCFLPTKIPAFQYSKKKGEVKGGGRGEQ